MKRVLAFAAAVAMLFSVAGCNGTSSGSSQPAARFTPGTYEGAAQGFGGEVKVAVTLTEDQIEKVEVLENSETEGIGSNAIDQLPAKMVETQTFEVEAVGGATVTSDALKEAVKAALTAAGADLSLFAAEESGPVQAADQTLDVDVVIVGAGGAGMTAAIEANAAGKKVLLVEKMGMAGGNTARATGGMNASGTKVQADKGVTDSVESFVEDTMKGGKDVNDEALVRALAENSAAAVEWLESIGAPLPDLTTLGGASNARAHRPEGGGAVGSYLVEKLVAKLEADGIEVLYNTAATEILMQDGKAVGIKANSAEVNYTINADAVIIATGGFAGSEEMYTQYNPDLKGFVTTNAPGITGDGIKMAQAAGAALVDMDQIQIHPTVDQATSIMITEGLRGDGAILVNQAGVRFVNEMETRDVVSAAEIAQEGSYAYLVFDQQLRDNVKAVESYVNNKLTVQADSIEELAAAIEVDPAALSETISKWNAAIAGKSDPDFGRATGMDRDISVGPFYAIKIAPGVHHTMGGIKINPSAEVLDESGAVIPGLYAAGEVTGGVHGANRLGGNAVTDVIVFGRQAAQSAVAYLGDSAPASSAEPAVYKDGEYRAEMTDEEAANSNGWKDFLVVTYQDGKVVKAVFDSVNGEGQLKSEATAESYPMDPPPSEWIPQISANIEKAGNSADIEAVAGATTASDSAKKLMAQIEEMASK